MRSSLSLVIGAVAATLLAVAVAFVLVTMVNAGASSGLPKSGSDFEGRVGTVEAPPNYGR